MNTKRPAKQLSISKYLPVILIILGALLRLIYINEIPAGLHNDEAFAAWNAYGLYTSGLDSSGHAFPVYFEAWGHGQSALYTYLILPLIALSGGEVSNLIIRLPQAIVAIFSLVVCYLLLKKMFDEKMALWGLFLLTICPWHIMMSRWGLDANLAPGFLLFGLYFFIKGLESNRYLVLSAFFYGLSLYCYALIWPVVPIIVLLQIIYGVIFKKIRVGKSTVIAGILLFFMALPLLLFLLINKGYLPEISNSFFSIYKMSSLRDAEIASSWQELLGNLKNTLYFLYHQGNVAPYDMIAPYNLFYPVGMPFIFLGALSLFYHLFLDLKQKKFSYEFFIFVQLIVAGILGCLIYVVMHKLNCIYIPLILLEAYGINTLVKVFKKFWPKLGGYVAVPVIIVFLVYLSGFEKAYYTEYKDMVKVHFQEQTQPMLDFAISQSNEIVIPISISYPKVLLYTNTSTKEYLDTVIYSEALPAPSQFTAKGTTYYFNYDYNQLNPDYVYIVYETDLQYFSDYQLTAFGYWYVATPKSLQQVDSKVAIEN